MKQSKRKSIGVGRKSRESAPPTFAEQLTKALDEKVETSRGSRTLGQLAVLKLWQRVLRGDKHAIRDWERLRELVGEFDVKSPMIIVVHGGLPDTDADIKKGGHDE